MNIYVVDDEPEVRESIAVLLKRAGHQVQSFANASAFLSVADDLGAGCVLLDLLLPDLDGLEVQRRLAERRSQHAIILLTGFGEVPEAVAAMRAGAVDFLRKPYRRTELLEAVDRAGVQLEAGAEQRDQARQFAALDALSGRERDVLRISLDGKASKEAAYELGLSVRTVEMHRANVMKKLGVTSFGAALLIAQRSGQV